MLDSLRMCLALPSTDSVEVEQDPGTDHRDISGRSQSSEDYQECCPVSNEPYAETGPQQPVFLPECGHTFAKATVIRLTANARGRRSLRRVIRCPLCNKTQHSLLSADDCVPNWDTINRLQYHASRRGSRPTHSSPATQTRRYTSRGDSMNACLQEVLDQLPQLRDLIARSGQQRADQESVRGAINQLLSDSQSESAGRSTPPTHGHGFARPRAFKTPESAAYRNRSGYGSRPPHADPAYPRPFTQPRTNAHATYESPRSDTSSCELRTRIEILETVVRDALLQGGDGVGQSGNTRGGLPTSTHTQPVDAARHHDHSMMTLSHMGYAGVDSPVRGTSRRRSGPDWIRTGLSMNHVNPAWTTVSGGSFAYDHLPPQDPRSAAHFARYRGMMVERAQSEAAPVCFQTMPDVLEIDRIPSRHHRFGSRGSIPGSFASSRAQYAEDYAYERMYNTSGNPPGRFRPHRATEMRPDYTGASQYRQSTHQVPSRLSHASLRRPEVRASHYHPSSHPDHETTRSRCPETLVDHMHSRAATNHHTPYPTGSVILPVNSMCGEVVGSPRNEVAPDHAVTPDNNPTASKAPEPHTAFPDLEKMLDGKCLPGETSSSDSSVASERARRRALPAPRVPSNPSENLDVSLPPPPAGNSPESPVAFPVDVRIDNLNPPSSQDTAGSELLSPMLRHMSEASRTRRHPLPRVKINSQPHQSPFLSACNGPQSHSSEAETPDFVWRSLTPVRTSREEPSRPPASARNARHRASLSSCSEWPLEGSASDVRGAANDPLQALLASHPPAGESTVLSSHTDVSRALKETKGCCEVLGSVM